jgi:hypothetical protein
MGVLVHFEEDVFWLRGHGIIGGLESLEEGIELSGIDVQGDVEGETRAGVRFGRHFFKILV